MDSGRSVTMAMWFMIALQTIGSVDAPGKGERKLPAPRAYVAIIVMFSILSIVADMPIAAAKRGAAMAAWVTVLAAMVLGPFGQTFLSFMSTISSKFATPPSATPTTPPPSQ